MLEQRLTSGEAHECHLHAAAAQVSAPGAPSRRERARGRSLAANKVAFTATRVLSTKVTEKRGAPHPFESFISGNNGGAHNFSASNARPSEKWSARVARAAAA